MADTTTPIQEVTSQLTAPGQTFEIDEIPVRGIPTLVWKNAPHDLTAVLELSRGHGDKDYLVYEDERTSFEEHYRIAAAISRALHSRFGLRKGERVTIAMRNLPEWAMAFWGTVTTGAVVVPLNAWWTGPELHYGLEDSGTAVAFVDAERLARLRPHLGDLPGLRGVVVTHEDRSEVPASNRDAVPVISFADLVGDASADAVFAHVDIDPDDDCSIFYTSGTTGKPKGAVGSHRNMCTNLMSLFFVNSRSAALRPKVDRAAEGDKPARVSSNSYLLSVPLFHATGCHSTLVANTAAGNKLVMMHHWDPERALELIEREHITTFGGVPAMVMQVIDSPSFAGRDTSSVRAVAYGGAPAPPDLVRRIKEHFPVSAPSNGYGLTETSSVTTINTGDDYVRKPDSVGPPVPVCEARIVPDGYHGDPAALPPSGPDDIGELWIKGPNVVRGYWNKPAETDASFTAGWLHSGDVARIDEEGFIYIVDRAKDMVIRGGENVYCVEVESVLFEHPAVADVAVIGVPHEILGEEVGAAVVLRPGAGVTAEELSLYVRQHLAGFKVPTHVWFRSEPLPRNPQGKVLKRELRESLTKER